MRTSVSSTRMQNTPPAVAAGASKQSRSWICPMESQCQAIRSPATYDCAQIAGDPQNTEGIVTIVGNTQREIDKLKAELDAHPRTVVYEHRSGFCTEKTTVAISGDLNSGFTGQATTSQRCLPEHGCTPRNCTPLLNEQAFAEREVKSRLLRMLGVSAPAEIVDVPIPQFTPSGFDVVDEMNHKRISIFEMMNRLARQQVMQQQMEKMRDMLAAPLN
jgi:hypothetical protein